LAPPAKINTPVASRLATAHCRDIGSFRVGYAPYSASPG
jgi:hypothetical protein